MGFISKFGKSAERMDHRQTGISLDNAGLLTSPVLDWLESESYSRDVLVSRFKRAATYRMWPLKLPLELEPMVKFYLFLLHFRHYYEIPTTPRPIMSLRAQEKDLLIVCVDGRGRTAVILVGRETCRSTVQRGLQLMGELAEQTRSSEVPITREDAIYLQRGKRDVPYI
jgi:hypothetical protein